MNKIHCSHWKQSAHPNLKLQKKKNRKTLILNARTKPQFSQVEVTELLTFILGTSFIKNFVINVICSKVYVSGVECRWPPQPNYHLPCASKYPPSHVHKHMLHAHNQPFQNNGKCVSVCSSNYFMLNLQNPDSWYKIQIGSVCWRCGFFFWWKVASPLI